MPEWQQVRGADLDVGDVIEVGFKRRDQILSFEPYTGNYKDDPGWEGARIASFTVNRIGMTVLAGDIFNRLVVEG